MLGDTRIPAYLGIPHRGADGELRGGVIAQHFFDGGSYVSIRVRTEHLPLTAIVEQRDQPVGEKVDGRLVAGDDQRVDHGRELLLREAFVRFGTEQRGNEVRLLARSAAAGDHLVDVSLELEQAAVLLPDHGRVELVAEEVVQRIAAPAPEQLIVLARHAEHVQDHPQRHLEEELEDVARLFSGELGQDLVSQRTGGGGKFSDAPWSERAPRRASHSHVIRAAQLEHLEAVEREDLLEHPPLVGGQKRAPFLEGRSLRRCSEAGVVAEDPLRLGV